MVRLMLVLGLVLSLAACGGSRTDGLGKAQEEALQARVEAAETEQAKAEAQKAAAEADKAVAEAAKVVAEAEADRQRQVAEAARQVAEAARQSAETARLAAEAARLAAEAARGEAEDAVAEADTARDETAAAQEAQQQAEEKADTAEQKALQADASIALTGLEGVTTPATVGVEAKVNAPATVTGVSGVSFSGGTGSSGGRGWHATSAKGRGDGIDADIVVYSDKRTLPRKKITDKYTPQTVYKRDADDNYAEILDEPTNEVRIPQTDLVTYKTRITGSTFPTGGDDSDVVASIDDLYDGDGEKNNAKVAGSFDGANGHYWCTEGSGETCNIDHDGTGYTFSGGTWEFRTSKAATVLNPDTEFMSFGWWRQKLAAGTFTYGMFSNVHGRSKSAVAPATSLSGSVKYVGPAAGQYAISLPLGGLSNHGEFEATAELNATFVPTGPDTISGRIYGFDVNSGWELTLGETTTSAATFTGDSVIWTIDDGTAAGQEGTWTGSFQSDDLDYDAATGPQPHGVTGTFKAAYGNTDAALFARMIGAYGAKR